jgi:hypothetical protein
MSDKLKYEDAVKIIKEEINRVESSFQKKTGRFPSLVNESDYIILSEDLDIPAFCNMYGNDEKGRKKLASEDVALGLIRNHLERQDLFNGFGEQRRYAFDAFVGNLDYHAPEKEYLMRIDALKRLNRFPEDIQELIKASEDISKKCILPELKSDPSEREKSSNNIGTWIVNPSFYIRLWLKRPLRKDDPFDEFMSSLKERAESARKYSLYE